MEKTIKDFKKKICFISGPISNDPAYSWKFERASCFLKSLSINPVNPAKFGNSIQSDGVDFDHDGWLTVDKALLALCDCVLVLEGFSTSKGSMAEIEYAESIGLPVFYWEDFKPTV